MKTRNARTTTRKAKRAKRLLPDRPITFGNFDTDWELYGFVPRVVPGAVKPYKIQVAEWTSIEGALHLKLDAFHREWVDWVCTFFIFACVLKDEIPSRDKYLRQMHRHVRLVAKLSRTLLGLLFVPVGKDGAIRVQGRMTTPQTDLGVIATSQWTDALVFLATLTERLYALGDEIEAKGAKKRGRDRHYELSHFLQTLIQIAASLGNNANIPSRGLRERFTIYKKNALLNFVDAIRDALGMDMPRILALYDVSEGAKAKAEKTLLRFLNKKSGTLVEDLMNARARAEGKPRRKKQAQ